jgi:hypothetical protein
MEVILNPIENCDEETKYFKVVPFQIIGDGSEVISQTKKEYDRKLFIKNLESHIKYAKLLIPRLD